MTSPLISIIIPVYNVEAYLKQCVDSILSQTYQNFELLLVDDGSTDSSGKICDDYANRYSNVRVIHQKNTRQAGARNNGINQAMGDYLMFVDSDDWIVPDALARLKEQLLNQPDVLVFEFFKYYEDKDVTRQTLDDYDGVTTNRSFLNQTAKTSSFYHGVPWNKLYKRSLLNSHNIRFIEGIVIEDGPFFLSVFYYARTVRICREALYFYRLNRVGSTMFTISDFHFRSALIGAEQCSKLYGWTNRHASIFILTMYLFSVTQSYTDESSTRKVLTEARSLAFKWKVLVAALKSREISKRTILALTVCLSPRLTRVLVRLKNRKVRR